VTLCDGGGTCLPSTTFGWQSGTNTPTVITNPSNLDGSLATYRPYAADFNGDGFADILWDKGGSATSPSSTGTRVLWTSNGTGGFTVTTNVASKDGTLSGYTPVIADFDRDGRPDILWYQINSSGVSTGCCWGYWMNTGAGSFTVVSPVEASVPTSTRAAIADVDGDGRSEITWIKTKSATVWIPKADDTVSSVSLNPVVHGRVGADAMCMPGFWTTTATD
jgi:hypothetical protein